MQRLLVIMTMLVGVFAAGWLSAQGSRPELTGQDYAEIEQLIAKYNQATDFEDLDMYASIFTEDAVWKREQGGQALIGREALVNSLSERFATRPAEHERRHWQNNHVITATPNGATSRVYFVSFEVSYVPPKPALSGHYDDVLVRTPEGWRIKERTLVLDQPLRDSTFGYVW